MAKIIYGNKDTIHSTNHLDVEVDKNGKVVGVWFRCMTLPFKQVVVSDERAESMKLNYEINEIIKIHAIEIEREK